MTTKTCITCRTDKPLNDFYERPDSIDGLRGDCKTCNNSRPRQSTPDRMLRSRAYSRATQNLINEHRDEFNAAYKRHVATIAAEAAVTRALRSRARAQAARDLINNHRDEFNAHQARHATTGLVAAQ